MANKTQQQDASAGNPDKKAPQMIGDDSSAELADAIRDADSPRSGDRESSDDGKITFKGDPGEEKPKKGGRASDSGILSTMRDHLAEGSDGGAGKGGKPAEDGDPQSTESDDPEDSGDNTEDIDDSVEGFEEVDININASATIKDKMKRLKSNERLTRAELVKGRATIKALLAEAEAKAAEPGPPTSFEESEDYKRMRAELDEASGLVERLRLEESPTFKKKFDDNIRKGVKSVQPLIKSITDAALRETTVQRLDAVINVPPGEDNDPAFYQALGSITGGIPEHLRYPMMTELSKLRGTINDRGEALANWREELKNVGDLEVQGVRQRAADAATNLKAIQAEYEHQNADRLGVFRKEEVKEVFKYDAQVGPHREALAKEIELTAQAGAPTKELIRMANLGTEFVFQSNLNKTLANAYKEEIARGKKLQEELEKFKGGGTAGGRSKGAGASGVPPARREPKEYAGGSGILETMRELRAGA